MNPPEEKLILKLAKHILQSKDEMELTHAMEYASVIFQAKIFQTSNKNIEFYSRKWKGLLSDENRQKLTRIQNTISSKPHPIFKIIDLLARSEKPTKDIQSPPERKRFSFAISEKDLIFELITLLQCGNGNTIKYEEGKFVISTEISPQFRKVTLKILSTVQCVHELSQSREKLTGIIGQALSIHIMSEVSKYIEYISKYNYERTTLIQLQSYLLTPETEKIHALTFIYFSIVRSSSNYMAAIAPLNGHGNPYVSSLAKKLTEACYSAILEFIQSWVIHGIIDDPYNEFFIKEDHSVNVKMKDPASWWTTQYTLVVDKIPPKFFDKETLMMILSCGKALNFIKEFKTNNFNEGYVPFKGKCFDLSMVDSFLMTSMNAVINLIIKENWLLGHLKVINDFMLFCRGDFATSLFYAINESDDISSVYILTRALKGIDFGKCYTNKLTGENLINYLDYKKNDSNVLASLVYKTKDPITTVVGTRAMKLYERFSKFVWRIRSIQLTLSNGWKFHRIPLFVEEEYIGGIGDTISGADLVSKIAGMRFNFLFASASLNEWISSDVILASRKVMEKQIQNATTFDQIIHYHKKYLHQLKRGFLLTEEFAQAQTALAQLVDVFDQFIALVKDIYSYFDDCDAHYQYILNGGEDEFQDSPDAEFDEFNQSLDLIQHTFNTKLKVLHAKVTQNLGIPEFSHLELRLLSCLKSGEKENQ